MGCGGHTGRPSYVDAVHTTLVWYSGHRGLPAVWCHKLMVAASRSCSAIDSFLLSWPYVRECVDAAAFFVDAVGHAGGLVA